MLAKLAFRNVRRSVRDYAIYFVTLVFGVAVFYAFNSVTGQSILFDLEDTATASVFEMTGQMLGMFSVVIACVLGFLVLYANGFLIRRRKARPTPSETRPTATVSRSTMTDTLDGFMPSMR